MGEAEADVFAHITLSAARTGCRYTRPIPGALERQDQASHRRCGDLPNEAAIVRVIGASLLEQNEEWQLQRRYPPLEGLQALGDNAPMRLFVVMS